uniref:Carboxyl-terminal protease n=1 Tax=uncultured bacterium UPO71 TaxID=1776990 RepID=A0A126SZ14_9BACT|nr:carboxyl-terminal protease [uncultured bacterium UPO71]
MSKLFKASALIAVGFFCALLLIRDGAHAERSEGTPTGATMDLPVQELRLFSEVLGIIRQNYVEPVSDGDLLKSAIRGMLSGLDPHSAYLEKEEFQELKEGTSGEFGGLGIEVGMEDGFVKVVSPIDDTPAQKAGVHAGDLIIRLDDTAVKGLSLNEAVKLMRGPPGTDITLTIVREGEEKPLQLKLTRAVIKVNSVRSRQLDPGYGYLRVSQFQMNTGRKLREEVSALKEKNGGTLKGLVLDLRNNPGGVLTAAVSVSDAFITEGLIVYTEGRGPEAEQKFSATSGDILDDVPIVVLVNAGSASASEIVAGALQDNGRAIIMGEKTFGKGSVQTILPIREDAALKLTTARYFTPKGRSIQAEGIEPDVPLERVQLTAVEQPFEPLGERDLARHLDNPNGKQPVVGTAPKPATDPKDSNLAKQDFGVHEALNLLKALNIVQARGK